MKKRLLATFLCLCMALTLLPAPAAGAASAAVTDADGLKTAIAAGGTVTLDGDFTVSETLNVSGSVTLDLNGHTVTAGQRLSYLFRVKEGASFILQDSGAGGALRATEPNPEESHPFTTDMVCMDGGEFWLHGGTLDAAAGDAVVIHYDATGASFLMTGGTLEGKTALYLRGRGNLAVVTGGSIHGSNNALYVDGVSYVYLGGDVTTDGALRNPRGALTVTGGTYSGVLYTGSSSQYADVPTALICGGVFHGVWQSKYGELMLYGGSFALDPDGTYSFKTNQTDKTLTDYVGAEATLNPSDADGTASFSVTGPEGYALQIVAVFGGSNGTVKADGTALDNTNRLIIDDGAEITATANKGYTSHIDDSKDGVILVTFAPETPVATLDWMEGGESKSAQLTGNEVRYDATGDYLRDADQDAGASMTFLADTAASLGFEGISPVTLTSDENGPYTLSRDMADDGHSKTGKMLSIASETSVSVTKLTLDGSVPPAPPYSTESPKFITVKGELTLGNETTVQNCQPSNYYNVPALPPAAVDVRGGDLTLASGSKIVNNQSRDGGVVKSYNGNVSLSGNVTIKGNHAVDLSDVSSFDQDELAAAPMTTANLVMYQTQQKAAGAPIQVTGALTGGEASIGLTLLYTEMDPEPTTGKVAAGAGYTLTETDLAAFFSDRPGYFLTLNTEENAIYLDKYAITRQPTADTPTVVVNQTKDAAYQWYPTTVVTEDVTDRNASPYQTTKDIDGSDVAVSSSYADGAWTAAIGDWDSGYFTKTLKKGDSLAVTLPTAAVPTTGQLGLYDKENYEQLWYYFRDFDPDEGVTAAEDGDNTVITYTVPGDGTYTLMPDGLSAAAPALSATVKGVHLGTAVSGQTAATLTADDAGDYLCQVSWPDGTVLDSGVISVAAAPYAITTQPTVANGYTVTASHSEKAHYQWYRSGDSADIGQKIALEGAAFGSAAEGADYEGSTGHWTGAVKSGACEFFTLNLKAGQLIYLDFENSCKGKTFTLTGDNGETVTATPTARTLYLLVPADGSYTLRISGLTYSSATLFSADLYPPLAGQTDATLVPAKGGSHFCMVTWDGTAQYELSDYVTPVIATTALTLEPETLALQVGQTETLDITRTPSDASDDITWASDNEEVATVDDWGEVEAVSVGTATVTATATANGVTASCTVTVTPVPAITQQPTPENEYTVGVNYAPEGISYQWYPAATSQKAVGTEDSETSVKAEPVEILGTRMPGDGAATFANGMWTPVEASGAAGYFIIDLKQGDILTLVMDTADVPDGGVIVLNGRTTAGTYPQQWYYFDGSEEPAEGVSVTTRGEDTLLTYIIPADGQYGLYMACRSYDPEDGTEQYYTPPTLSATLTHAELGEAVSGQTTAQLTAETEGNYLCRVTWPDGTALNSNVVAYAPPDPGESKGEVEVKGDTPPVAVDEDALKDLAGEIPAGQTVTVKLTVEKQETPADKEDIQGVVTGKKDDVLYLDLSLLKTTAHGDGAPTTVAIPDTGDKVLEIAVDYDFTGKKDVTVYRKHGDDPAAALDKLTKKPTEAFADGSFFADSANGKVYIYASKFSTYAIGYTAETTTPSRPSGGNSSGYRWPFVDVKRTDSCYQAVKYAYDNKLMEGTSATTFDPEGELTRAMLATVLYRAAGSPKVTDAPEFEDTKADQWYSDAVAWANQTHVLRGYGNGSFGPEDPVSKEMMNMVVGRLKGEDPAWMGDPALALPATRAEIAQLLMEQDKKAK